MRHSTTQFIIPLAILIAGCQAVPENPWVPHENASMEQNLRMILHDEYPQTFRATHRTIISIREVQYVLDGFLLVRQPDNLRLIASADIGGSAFDVLSESDSVRVVGNPANLRHSWLKFAVRDAKEIYLHTPSDRAILAKWKDKTIALVEELPNGARNEYRFDASTGRIRERVQIRRGRYLYRVQFSNMKTFPLWSKSIPTRFVIDDFENNYSLSILVTDLQPIVPTDNMFPSKE